MTGTDKENRKVILLGLVLDATLSFSAVYAQIYYMIERLVISLQEKSESMKDVEVRYGVTLLRERPESLLLERDQYFTANSREVLRRLADVDFYGGTDEGFEELGQAIRTQQRLMEQDASDDNEEIMKDLMLFTDSMPSYGSLIPDYAEPDRSEIENRHACGVSSAYFYTYNGEYMPQMRIADGDGMITESNSGTCIFGSISEVLNKEEKETIAAMEDLADSILANGRKCL